MCLTIGVGTHAYSQASTAVYVFVSSFLWPVWWWPCFVEICSWSVTPNIFLIDWIYSVSLVTWRLHNWGKSGNPWSESPNTVGHLVRRFVRSILWPVSNAVLSCGRYQHSPKPCKVQNEQKTQSVTKPRNDGLIKEQAIIVSVRWMNGQISLDVIPTWQTEPSRCLSDIENGSSGHQPSSDFSLPDVSIGSLCESLTSLCVRAGHQVGGHMFSG